MCSEVTNAKLSKTKEKLKSVWSHYRSRKVQRSRVKVLEDENKNLKQSIEYAQASIAKLLRTTEACRSMFCARSCYQRIKSGQGAMNEVHRWLFKLECHSRRNNTNFFFYWGHYFYVFYSFWRRDRHFTCTWSSERREGLAVCMTKAVPSFLIYFKTLSIGPVAGTEPVNSRSAVKRSTKLTLPRKMKVRSSLKECTALLHERLRLIKRSLGPDQLIIANLAYFQDKDIIKCFLKYVYVSKGSKYRILDVLPNEVDD